MDEPQERDERPLSGHLLLAAVLSAAGLGAIAMLVLAAASVVFR